jgi:hypothetical protein
MNNGEQFDCQHARASKHGDAILPTQLSDFGASSFIQLVGGHSYYMEKQNESCIKKDKNNIPTISIKNVVAKDANAARMQTFAQGHYTFSVNQDNDNIGLWLATEFVPTYYSYTIEARRP